jgi:hypothetical protein
VNEHHHDHPHPHPPEAAPGPSTGAVVLDIGGDMGAAVVLTPASMDALEIEIRTVGTEWDSTHVAVRERIRPGGPSMYAAVFPSLRHGAYEFRVRFGPPDAVVHRVEVTGGQVATTNWPADSATDTGGGSGH